AGTHAVFVNLVVKMVDYGGDPANRAPAPLRDEVGYIRVIVEGVFRSTEGGLDTHTQGRNPVGVPGVQCPLEIDEAAERFAGRDLVDGGRGRGAVLRHGAGLVE